MMVTQPPSSITDFVKHHGEEGGRCASIHWPAARCLLLAGPLRLYLHMSRSGVELQKSLAEKLAPETVRQQGSLCVAFPEHSQQLEQDFHARGSADSCLGPS